MSSYHPCLRTYWIFDS